MPMVWDLGGARVELDRCPRRPIFEDPLFYDRLFQAYAHWKQGILPEEGSLLSQPSVLTQMVQVIDGELADIRGRRDREDQGRPTPTPGRGLPPRMRSRARPRRR